MLPAKKEPGPARVTFPAPQSPLCDMVAATGKPNWKISHVAPSLQGALGVPDTHRRVEPSAVTTGFPDVLFGRENLQK